VPDFKPVFVTALFWCGAFRFLAATLLAKQRLGYGLALAAGLCIALLFFFEVLVRFGYFRVERRLVALPHDIPRWRFTLDKPVFDLLLISTLISLVLSVTFLIVQGRTKLHAGIRS
jgi:MFS superfamily sulfate permease-like transporter